MSDEYDAVQVIHFQHADHVGDMGVEVDGWVDEMRAIPLSSKRHRKGAMAGRFEVGNDPVPAPTAMPRAMNQNEGRHRFGHLPVVKCVPCSRNLGRQARNSAPLCFACTSRKAVTRIESDYRAGLLAIKASAVGPLL